jgi:hypothetical protein
MDMLQRMESGRFKVFKHLNDWWEAFRLYHRKDGKVVKEDRRPNGRHKVRNHDAPSRIDSAFLSELPPQAKLSESWYRMTRQFVVWNNLKSENGDCSWAIVDGMLTVKTCHGSKTIKFDGGSPEGIAKVLTWEIAADLDGLIT